MKRETVRAYCLYLSLVLLAGAVSGALYLLLYYALLFKSKYLVLPCLWIGLSSSFIVEGYIKRKKLKEVLTNMILASIGVTIFWLIIRWFGL